MPKEFNAVQFAALNSLGIIWRFLHAWMHTQPLLIPPTANRIGWPPSGLQMNLIMKTRTKPPNHYKLQLGLLTWLALALSGLAQSNQVYTITNLPGWTAIANQLDHSGGNNINNVITNVPDQ